LDEVVDVGSDVETMDHEVGVDEREVART